MGAAKVIAPGTVLGGDYEVERQLAAGGMGAVYVARQRSTQKLRALKTLLPEHVADLVMRARFAREAIIGGQIESDHVVEVLAAGIDEPTGLPWLVMELLAGDDLAATVKKRGPLPTAEVVEVVRQLGHALAAAHRAGVVHRDLKPENIFLATARRDGVAFMVKVLDFGIARLLYAVRTSHTTSAMGSPLWMAPEQTDAALPVSPATDVWALGLIAFWLLTGRYFWLTPTQPDASIGAMIRELLIDALPTASQRAAQLGVAARLPPGFDAWFARCVDRDAAARYRDAGEAVAPLLALLASPLGPVAMAGQNMSHPVAGALPPTGVSRGDALPQSPIPATMAVPAASLLANASAGAPQPPAAPTPRRSKTGLVIAGALAASAVVVVAAWAFTRAPAEPDAQMESQVGAVIDAALAPPPPGADAAPTPGAPAVLAPQGGSSTRTIAPLTRDVPAVFVPGPVDASSPPADASTTVVAPPPDRPVAPPDLGAPVVDHPAAPLDLGAPAVDLGAPAPPPPPPPPPPTPSPDPVSSGDPCARNGNCSSCVAADGCGWCNNVNRCLSGSWASGPTSRACARGPEWVSEADHCEDRCARASNCASCVGIEGCGWCGNVNRCVAGSWARGPYLSVCARGPQWATQADQCQ